MSHFMNCGGGKTKDNTILELKMMREVTVPLRDRGHKLLITRLNPLLPS